jgi:Kef-type K+ transport system membrane component KefB
MDICFIILEKAEPIAHLISQKLKKLWIFAELLLFVLVGSQVNIHVAWKAGLAGAIVIFVGIILRSVGTYVSLFGTPFDWKEKLFCVIAYIPKATVQAAIGAIPLAAGVAAGEVILAVAVLSILITAPLGAIGIMISGERILDYGEQSTYRFKELREKLGLPHVGERVRSKVSGTIWKVIEQKEVWLKAAAETGSSQDPSNLLPAIYLRYWKEKEEKGVGKGKTLSYHYTQKDPSFDDHWEILYDW